MTRTVTVRIDEDDVEVKSFNMSLSKNNDLMYDSQILLNVFKAMLKFMNETKE